MRPPDKRRATLVAAVDFGTSKTACLIARLTPDPAADPLPRWSHAVEILGIARGNSHGIKAGAVSNFDQAEQAARQALDSAEDGRFEVRSIVLSVSGGRLASELISASLDVAGIVTNEDMSKVAAAVSPDSSCAGRTTLHCLPGSYSVDAFNGIRDPRKMLAHRLGVNMLVVTVDTIVARNLELALESSHAEVEALVASPYAAGLSVLTEDETEHGAAVVDMGAGTTTLAAFSAGHLLHVSGFALGGHHITMDLARGINARLRDAERLKIAYGLAASGEMISIPDVGIDGRESAKVILPSAVVRIIKPRIEEILEMVRDRLADSPFNSMSHGQVVLTGGASQLQGLPELAARILARPVRLGQPMGIAGLADQFKGPAFAVATGLLIYPQVAHLEHLGRRRNLMTGTAGYFGQVAAWLREGFL
jgi:cell division protein FtsA